MTTTDRVIVSAATLGPLGTALPAPGTWGSLAGLLFVVCGWHELSLPVQAIALVVLMVASVYICGAAELLLNRKDPSCVILDEFCAMPLCFFGLSPHGPPALPWLAGGFILFRLLDIFKPLGIAEFQKLPGGWGIVADDGAAALLTCLCLNAAERWLF